MEKYQQEIPFEFIEKDLTIQRGKFRKEALKHFTIVETDIYERLVFDLTHKDFEYFLCYILDKEFNSNTKNHQEISVVEKELDQKGVDVIREKDDIKYFYQCKQWSSAYIDIKQVGSSYAKLYLLTKKDPRSWMCFVSTSYLQRESEMFLEDHGVEYLWNRKIIDLALKYHLHIKSNWIKLIEFIQSKRLELYNQQRLPIWISEFQKLQEDRLQEETMHTQNYKKCGKVLPPKSKSPTFMNFTEWWTTS